MMRFACNVRAIGNEEADANGCRGSFFALVPHARLGVAGLGKGCLNCTRRAGEGVGIGGLGDAKRQSLFGEQVLDLRGREPVRAGEFNFLNGWILLEKESQADARACRFLPDANGGEPAEAGKGVNVLLYKAGIEGHVRTGRELRADSFRRDAAKPGENDFSDAGRLFFGRGLRERCGWSRKESPEYERQHFHAAPSCRNGWRRGAQGCPAGEEAASQASRSGWLAA